MNSKNTTVIICCAGMGTRLGIGATKALIDVCDKPLIIRLLEQLDKYDDVRIVIGYQFEKMINTVNEYRRDIVYAFNKEYESNGPAASMWKGLKNARENVIILDGDIIVEPKSFKKFLKYDGECIAYSTLDTDEPLYLNIKDNKVMNFSNKKTKHVFSGIIKIKKDKIKAGKNYIYKTIKHNLPLPAIEVKAMEIDTQDDYEKVVEWVKKNYKG